MHKPALHRRGDAGRVLLVNPAMTKHPRFPLSILSLGAALDGHHDYSMIDGNVDHRFIDSALSTLGRETYDAVGVSVMGGPQLRPAIELSRAIKRQHPKLPIVWGGYFPTLYPEAAIEAAYVDLLIRGPGESTLLELLEALRGGEDPNLDGIAGLTWKTHGKAVHNARRPPLSAGDSGPLPYHRLGDPDRYLGPSFLGKRTSVFQGALGCRYRCTFCGVAAMFKGGTRLPAAQRLEQDLRTLKDRYGVDSILFCDHNFFDREEAMLPILEVLAKLQLPWWCYARADALLALSEEGWRLVQKSGLRMTYIGAESPSDQLLRDMRKGTKADQTMAVAELCRAKGVIPEFSFMVAPPVDPVGETERTFDFIRRIKRVNPASEIIIYIYTPIPGSQSAANFGRRGKETVPLRDRSGLPIQFPATPDAWAEPMWIKYACHTDAPWVSPRLRRRINDFSRVLECRFPTVQDHKTPHWGKAMLGLLSSWRYSRGQYDYPWELDLARKLIRLRQPRIESL
jgi:anaerobic magnesium-protoporphyrin IX monomethyl ester cyclase